MTAELDFKKFIGDPCGEWPEYGYIVKNIDPQELKVMLDTRGKPHLVQLKQYFPKNGEFKAVIKRCGYSFDCLGKGRRYNKEKWRPPEDVIRRELRKAITELYDSGYVHDDIATRNATWDYATGTVYLIDFGKMVPVAELGGSREEIIEDELDAWMRKLVPERTRY